MTRLQTAATAVTTDPCALCAGEVLPLQLEDGTWVQYELCGTCNGAFQDLAGRLAEVAR